MEEVEANVKTEKEGIESSEIPIYDGKSNAAAAVADHKPVIVDGNLRRSSGPARRSSKANWTEEEDDVLRNAVQEYEGKCWKKIAERLPGRTDVQCLHRWQKVLKPDLIKGPWSKEEDDLLIELVAKFSEKKWSEIAEQLPGRMGKQCRERWYNHLKPEINKAAWTAEEERILINAHAVYGNKWSILAKFLPGRTENSVKNHWNCSLKKKIGSYPSSCSAANHPQSTIRLSHGNNNGTSREFVEQKRNLSTNCLYKETVNSRSNGESSSMDLFHGRTGYFSNKPLLISLLPPETLLPYTNSSGLDKRSNGGDFMNSCSIRPRRHSDIYDHIQSLSGWPYTGLCYKPIQKADLNIFLSTGRFPSSESYILQPRSLSVPPSRTRSNTKESSDLYSSTKSILRRAAMSYHNMPSIIRKRASQTLQKGVSLKKTVEVQEGPKGKDDQVGTLSNHGLLSPKYQKLEKFAAIKSVGKCLEQESIDAGD